MIALLIGLVIGFLMCIPVGPINVWVINTHIKKGQSLALAIAFGGSVMDFIYFFIIMSGLSFATFSEDTILYLKIIGITLIFGLGVKELLAKAEVGEIKDQNRSVSNVMGCFALGVIIYTSNPTLVLTMTGLGAFVKSLELLDSNFLNNFLISLGLAAGSFLWFVFLVKVVDRYQEKIRDKFLGYFNKASGVLMIALSFYMGYGLYS